MQLFFFGRCEVASYRGPVAPTDRHRHEALARLLREERRARSITQEDLAARLGAHRVFVTKYESGERTLDVLELLHICRELSLDLGAVLRAIDNDEPATLPAREDYLLGFCKGFLLAKGYDVAKP